MNDVCPWCAWWTCSWLYLAVNWTWIEMAQEHLSNESHIVLNSVQSQSVGRYSCEVSADAPSFHTLFDSADLKVVGKFRPLVCVQCSVGDGMGRRGDFTEFSSALRQILPPCPHCSPSHHHHHSHSDWWGGHSHCCCIYYYSRGYSGDGIVEGGTAGNCNWVNKLKFDSLECIDWNGLQGRRRRRPG